MMKQRLSSANFPIVYLTGNESWEIEPPPLIGSRMRVVGVLYSDVRGWNRAGG
jgi:hypothetical protein